MHQRRCHICYEWTPIEDFHEKVDRCRSCHKIYMKEYYAVNRDRLLAQQAAYVQKHQEARRAYRRAYHQANREKALSQMKAWAAANPDAVLASSRRWRKAHPEQKRGLTAIRAKRLRQAMPSWIDREAIKRFYENCPPGHDVDHIIPIKAMRDGQHVASGLHVPWNLQYLPESENIRKGAALPEAA